MTPRDRRILKLAAPSIVSNITVPLLGLIDVSIVGHMGDAVYIGAVAVGSMIFNLIYWLFGFLRMGTSGMTAQAYGRHDMDAVTSILVRSVLLGLFIATMLLVLQAPLRWLMFWLIGPTPDVAPLATDYFRIVIWGAPASLSLFALTGWFIGMQNTRIPMTVSILQNVVNIVASLCMVYGLGMKIEGVAMGTVIAQYAGVAMAAGLLLNYKTFLRHIRLLKEKTSSSSFLKGGGGVNRDLFLRTLCLVAVNLYFTSAGARQGTVILSVNTVLMQFYLFFSYFMDGFANAGEAMGGHYYGARNHKALEDTLRRLFRWAAVVTVLFTFIYIVGGMQIVRILTDEAAVRETARQFLWWTWVIPVAGVAAFIWDGIFVGLTATRGMLIASFIAAILFFGIYILAQHCSALSNYPNGINHGLWLAQVTYLAVRGLVQTVWYKSRILHK